MRAKEGAFMTLKTSVRQQYITIPNVCASKNRVSVNIKQKPTETKGERQIHNYEQKLLCPFLSK